MFITKKLHNKIVEAKKREIEQLKKENKELKQIRILEVRNNTKILEQNNRKTKLINSIKEILEINKYNRVDVALEKIKELVRDYQSKTSS